LKILIILLASAGIVLSIYSSYTCQYLYIESEILYELEDPPFERWIGIFKYESVHSDETEGLFPSERCSLYGKFLIDFPALFASQLCALVAPILALIAVLVSIFELLCCKFFGGFVATSVLLLAASLFQSGTFGIFLVDPNFCFRSGGECEIGRGVFYSAFSVISFYISCIILCCGPRPSPCLQHNNERKRRNLSNLSSMR